MIVTCIQPNFAPWMGYFDQIRRANHHVFYDDVAFSRKGWANRNRVRGADDKAAWLTIPVMHGQGVPLLCETGFAQHGGDWRADIVNKLRQWYRKAPFVHLVDQLEIVLAEPYATLADVNIAIIMWMADLLGIHTPMQRSSLMDIPRDLDTTARPLAICQAFGARVFLCGPTAQRYIDQPIFTEAGVRIDWHQYVEKPFVYATHREPFIPNLSAIDYLLEHGPGWPEEQP